MFKKCPMCEKNWETLDKFYFNGYQVNIIKPFAGLFIFTHKDLHCGTTVAIKINKFATLIETPIPNEPIVRPPDCPGHCYELKNQEKCNAYFCPGQVIRDILAKLTSKRDMIV